MACSVRSSPIAFPAEVARYLMVEPEDVKRMIRMDKLPAIEIPMLKRKVTRIHLRDFHLWLLHRSKNPSGQLANYEIFLADFDASARTKAA